MSYSAEIIADSVNLHDDRLTSFVITLPRIVLAELNTHRALSKNSASSRAIPFKTMMECCLQNPFSPIEFQKAHKGMQGTEVFGAVKEIKLRHEWEIARNHAVNQAKTLHEAGVTKQICNRLLEPFSWHTVIITGSKKGWENFFALRAHEAAEIHIQKIAYMMLRKYDESNPKQLQFNEWHTPFGEKMDLDECKNVAMNVINCGIDNLTEGVQAVKSAIATARCARVSYVNFAGQDNYEADLKLHDRLAKMGHWSPFEHCAMCANLNSLSGNFSNGWFQYRKMFENECRRDKRCIQKY